MKLVKGRPENIENRIIKEIRVYDLLDEKRISKDLVETFLPAVSHTPLFVELPFYETE